MSKADAEATMRAVVFKDGDAWIAQALEHDICAQAHDLATLRLRFNATVRAEASDSIADGKPPLAGIPPAPQHYFDMWERRSNFIDQTKGEVAVDLALVA